MDHYEIVLADDTPGLGKRGQKVSLALSPSDVRQPEEISTYLAGYYTQGFRGDEASKVILVDHDEDKFRSFDSDDAFKRVQVKGSMQGAIPEVDPKTSLSTYKVVEKYVGSFIPMQTELNADKGFKPRAAAARRCKRALQLDREFDVWGILGSASSWAAGNVLTLTAGTQAWNTGSAPDPILDLQTIMEASAQQITDFWMNPKVANAFLRASKVRDFLKVMMGDGAMNQQVVNMNQAVGANAAYDFTIPGFPTFHIVAPKAKDAAGALQYILSSNVCVGTVSPPGVPSDGEEIASSYTFRRRGPSGVGFETREFFVDGRGPLGGTMIVAAMADIPIMTGNNVGGIIVNVTT
jgi:hypothetical protein